jgi:2-amino-4-hydroxy-6-hydroxymethyldihydropteridine diphosphokinase
MVRTFLSLGSNLGNRKTHLDRAVEQLRAEGVVVRNSSSVYETEPVGFAEQPWFLNQVVEAETALTPEGLLSACHSVERREGRVRAFRNAPRTLDLDILLYGTSILADPDLVIPHPRMAERRFVLAPLAEIAPLLIHPGLQRTIGSLLEECQDPSTVRVYSPEDSATCPNT